MNKNNYSLGFLIESFKEIKNLGLKKNFYIVFILACIDSVLEIFGTSFFLVIFSKIIFGLNFEKFEYISFLNEYPTNYLLIGFVFFYICKIIFSACIVYYFNYLQADVYKDLRVRFFNNFLNKPVDELQKTFGYQIIEEINVDTNRFVSNVFISLAKICRNVLTVLFIIVFLIYLNPINFLVILFILGFFSLIFLSVYKEALFSLSKKERQREIEIFELVGNLVKNLRDIKNFMLETHFSNLMLEKAKLFKKESLKIFLVTFMPRYVVEILLIFLITSVFIITNLIYDDIASNTINLSAIGYCFIRVAPLVVELSRLVSEFFLSREYLLNFKRNVSGKNRDYIHNIKNTISDKFTFKSLELEKILFKFDEKVILQDLDFKIEKGKNIFIHGESGVGKSVLLDIISLFRNPNKGKILINGKENINNNYFSKDVVFIHQNLNLLNNLSIASNITYGQDFDEQDLLKINSSLEKAQLDSFCEKATTFKLSSDIQNISEGQKKRLALARAFYFDKKILLLDEFTSNIDADNEKKILENLCYDKEYTIIVISHNVKNLELYDFVYELKDKKLVKK